MVPETVWAQAAGNAGDLTKPAEMTKNAAMVER
jgi:hypothetical protein